MFRSFICNLDVGSLREKALKQERGWHGGGMQRKPVRPKRDRIITEASSKA